MLPQAWYQAFLGEDVLVHVVMTRCSLCTCMAVLADIGLVRATQICCADAPITSDQPDTDLYQLILIHRRAMGRSRRAMRSMMNAKMLQRARQTSHAATKFPVEARPYDNADTARSLLPASRHSDSRSMWDSWNGLKTIMASLAQQKLLHNGCRCSTSWSLQVLMMSLKQLTDAH